MPDATVSPTVDPHAFLERWRSSGAAEQANSQLFLGELCDLLGVPRPEPTRQDDAANVYVFEKVVEINNGDGTQALGRIDLYRKGAFVLESKQGSERKLAEDEALSKVVRGGRQKTGTAPRGTKAWDQAMTRARNQAKRYAEALPDEWPPLLIVCDVGFCLDVYADFARTGKNYAPFPDPQSFRIWLEDLTDAEIRERLRLAWLDPLALDPGRRSARVTRELAAKLAELAKRLERQAAPDAVAQFLMRCLFTVFAEDVNLLPKSSFNDLLTSLRDTPENFAPMVESLWATMDTGGFSPILRQKLLRFNGGLFEDRSALPLDRDQLELLIEASEAEWTDVEPAIFGTLLERALDPRERHKLGAHYTPRAYVERLVVPTIMEPLRAEWDDIYAAAVQLDADGDTKAAIALVREFHGRLCEVRILDPACGSGNFLYVALELIKRLEGEVLNALKEFGDQGGVLLTVDPHQFLGIEINPRAAAIADLVLWIGYLQWHFRTRGKTTPPEPVLHAFHNIENRDAVLAHDGAEPVLDDAGNPVTRWDGRTTKPHPVTGEEAPDETARVPVLRYLNPRKAEWPEAGFIIGNPPYLGARTNRLALGDGYLAALRQSYPNVPDNVDYVMYWWHLAAETLQHRKTRHFGLITTKSISQPFAQRLIRDHFQRPEPISFRFAVPNHPWVDSSDGADVRVALTVCDDSEQVEGELKQVTAEQPLGDGEVFVALETRTGVILPDLRIGANLGDCRRLRANDGLCCVGYQLSGKGFVLNRDSVATLRHADGAGSEEVVKPLLSARDIAQTPRGLFAIDLFGFEADEVRRTFPAIFQWILDRVKPERDQNNRAATRDRWWLFGECRSTFRPALRTIARLIVTPLTAKHRYFQFAGVDTVCDSTCVMIAFDDGPSLGILSSHIHIVWAISAGGRLGVGDDPRYLKARCFDPFPFPACTDSQQTRIRNLAEALDAHRKRQQAAHPGLTMTGMYNVLERLRAGEPLTAKEKTIHEQGLVSVLRQLHDDLDAAVADAYGWPVDLTDEQILERLVALNKERAAEEARGLIRWLRPEFQNPQGTTKTQKSLTTDEPEVPVADARGSKGKAAKIVKRPWPAPLPERIQAVRSVLHEGRPLTAYELSRRFTRAKTDTVAELLDTLVALGQARRLDDGRYAA